MDRKPKKQNVERNLRVQKCGEEGLQYLQDEIGLNDDQVTSLVLQIREQCPSLNTTKKAIARLMNSLHLFREECKGLCRAADRFNGLMGPIGVTPPSVAGRKREKFMKQSGLARYLERRDKVEKLEGPERGRWLPSASDIAGEEGGDEIRKLIRQIASEDDPCHKNRLAQLLRWGAILSSPANGRKNKRK